VVFADGRRYPTNAVRFSARFPELGRPWCFSLR
jgi:hypothetical protein